MVEIFIKKVSPLLYKSMGIYLPLITTNCAVLGTALIVTTNGFNFEQMLVYCVATSFGYTFIIYILGTKNISLN